MASPRADSENARLILTLLRLESINHSSLKKENPRLHPAREVCGKYIQKGQFFAPALTMNVAVTFLKTGLCQELSQRFVLEYCKRFKVQNVSLIIATAGDTLSANDHMFVYIGELNVPDNLFFGMKDNSSIIAPAERFMPIEDFLKMNTRGIIVDPLLNCAGNTAEDLKPLHDYIHRCSITKISGVRSYHNTHNFIESLELIEKNAHLIANTLEPILSSALLLKQDDEVTPANFIRVMSQRPLNNYINRLQDAIEDHSLIRKSIYNKQRFFVSTHWLQQLPNDSIDELCENLHVDPQQLQRNIN